MSKLLLILGAILLFACAIACAVGFYFFVKRLQAWERNQFYKLKTWQKLVSFFLIFFAIVFVLSSISLLFQLPSAQTKIILNGKE